eukprot:TRINITY_DN6372_c0_g1_i6.p1 TRINITY_DN6372_c0_g1~~TRINITY_DN6372_c0_g1_i6.p1  ORF type:complete len:291 (-),score=92.57 TRINITY_DN6372_c0_g1_i6:415-1287(-)
MPADQEILDAELQKSMEVDAEHVSGDEMTVKVVSLQNHLDQLRFKAMKARAELESLDPCYKVNHFYTKDVSAEQMNNLTKTRTNAFLKYCTLKDALTGSQAVKALKAGLEVVKESESGEDFRLESEEKQYVMELMDEEKELSKELREKSKTCTDQEIEILQMRKEVAENLVQISESWAQINDSGTGSADLKDETLEKRLKDEEAKLNQMRLMIQKLMIGEKNFGQIFDDETNARFKKMLFRLGMKPEELRSEMAAAGSKTVPAGSTQETAMDTNGEPQQSSSANLTPNAS